MKTRRSVDNFFSCFSITQVGTKDLASGNWFMGYNDSNPFTIKTAYLGSMSGGGQSEWMFPKNAGGDPPSCKLYSLGGNNREATLFINSFLRTKTNASFHVSFQVKVPSYCRMPTQPLRNTSVGWPSGLLRCATSDSNSRLALTLTCCCPTTWGLVSQDTRLFLVCRLL